MKNTNMKTMMSLAVMAAALTAVSVPAMANAQGYGRPNPASMDRWDGRDSVQIDRRIDMVQDRLDMGRRTGALSRSEATRLNTSLRNIISTKRTYERTGRGLDGREVATLNAKLDYLSGQMRFERRDGNRW